jgi:hypothetical protein
MSKTYNEFMNESETYEIITVDGSWYGNAEGTVKLFVKNYKKILKGANKIDKSIDTNPKTINDLIINVNKAYKILDPKKHIELFEY